MKKILVISASPRKGGNSDLLCDQFAKGATEAGHKVEKVRLAEKKIGYCLGCSSRNSAAVRLARQDRAAQRRHARANRRHPRARASSH